MPVCELPSTSFSVTPIAPSVSVIYCLTIYLPSLFFVIIHTITSFIVSLFCSLSWIYWYLFQFAFFDSLTMHSGKQPLFYLIYETVDVTRSGMYIFNYYVVSLSKF